MKPYLVTFEAAAPLILRKRRAAQNSETLQYISGGTLLGGLAYTYLRQNKLDPDHLDVGFDRLFLQDRVWIGNLYPANFSNMVPAQYPVKPLPHTARSCKRWSGFTYETDEDNRPQHGVADHLIFWGLFAETKERGLEIFTDHAGRNRLYCHCQQRLDRISGFYRRQDTSLQGRASVNTRLVTGTGINRLTGTVQEEILYTMEVISEVTIEDQPQQFQGMIWLDEAVEEEFLAFLRNDRLHLRVGKGKTRGLGRLAVGAIQSPPIVGFEQFKKRIQDFDRAIKNEAAQKNLPQKYAADIGNGFYFALTCCSDVIVPTDDLRYATCLTQEYLPGLSNTQLIYHNASIINVSGWNALWRLPKTVEPAIEKGSVFLFKYSGNPDQNFLQALYDLEQNGIGIRRNEGFGWITISDDFHQEVEQR